MAIGWFTYLSMIYKNIVTYLPHCSLSRPIPFENQLGTTIYAGSRLEFTHPQSWVNRSQTLHINLSLILQEVLNHSSAFGQPFHLLIPSYSSSSFLPSPSPSPISHLTKTIFHLPHSFPFPLYTQSPNTDPSTPSTSANTPTRQTVSSTYSVPQCPSSSTPVSSSPSSHP